MAKTTRRAASKAEALAGTLRLAIASGEFPANSLLPGEVELMEQHNISRPTYREAIRVLEAEGLLTVERGPRGGTRVLRPTIEPIARQIGFYFQMQRMTLGEVMDYRLQTEPAAVHHIVRARNFDAIEALRACMVEQRAAISRNDPAEVAIAYNELDDEFRRTLVKHSGNGITEVFGEILDEVMTRHLENRAHATRSAEEDLAGRYEAGVGTKMKLIRRAEAGDAEEAANVWRLYLNAYRERIEEMGRDRINLMPVAC